VSKELELATEFRPTVGVYLATPSHILHYFNKGEKSCSSLW